MRTYITFLDGNNGVKGYITVYGQPRRIFQWKLIRFQAIVCRHSEKYKKIKFIHPFFTMGVSWGKFVEVSGVPLNLCNILNLSRYMLQ